MAEVNWMLSLAGMVLYPSLLLCFTGGSILGHGEPGPGVWWVHDGRIVLETSPGQPLSCTHWAPIRFGIAGCSPPSEVMGLSQTAAGVLASWSCLGRQSLSFLFPVL